MDFTNQPIDNQDLFPVNWVQTDAVQTVIRVSPMGVCLLRAVRSSTRDTPGKRNEAESITDFNYMRVNEVMQAMINLPFEDILQHNMRSLSHDSRISHLISRLAQTVISGQPGQYAETFQLDGVPATYHQLYVKSDDGILILIQDVTYTPLSRQEEAAYDRLLQAITNGGPIPQVRTLLLDLISGQTS